MISGEIYRAKDTEGRSSGMKKKKHIPIYLRSFDRLGVPLRGPQCNSGARRLMCVCLILLQRPVWCRTIIKNLNMLQPGGKGCGDASTLCLVGSGWSIVDAPCIQWHGQILQPPHPPQAIHGSHSTPRQTIQCKTERSRSSHMSAKCKCFTEDIDKWLF